MSVNQTTADNAQSSQPGAQHTGKLDAILNKVGGLGNIVHGTGKIIHGHVPGAGDPAQGGKDAIKTAGRQEVERGLDRIEGKPTDTSAAGRAPGARDSERGGVGDDTGAAPTTAPQATTAGAKANGTRQQGNGTVDGPGAQRDTKVRQQDQGNAAGGHDRSATSGSPDVQGDTDTRQQANGFASGDRDKAQETRTTEDTSDPVNTAAGQERPSGRAQQV